ncbi:MAG: DUF7562 family protein [Halohasta sp.]
MWRTRSNRDRETITCTACGASVPRSAAREYDKEGNRWERHDKEFEHFCKDCFRELCHQPRGDLEATLVEIEADGLSQTEFLARYLDSVGARSDRTDD